MYHSHIIFRFHKFEHKESGNQYVEGKLERPMKMLFAMFFLITACGPVQPTEQMDLSQQFAVDYSLNGDELKNLAVRVIAPGKIFLNRDLIIHDFEGKEVAVGQVKDGVVTFCEEAFRQACRKTVSRLKPGKSSLSSKVKEIITIHLHLDSLAGEEISESFGTTNDSEEISAQANRFSLQQYVLPSPHQDEGGTCLYMANTGAVEILLNAMNRNEHPTSEGLTDLSERYLINIRNHYNLGEWVTDIIDLFNQSGGSLLNRDYRYTKGWFRKRDSEVTAASPRSQGAEYGTGYNWIDALMLDDHKKHLIATPKLSRSVLFERDDLWDVAVMSDATIHKVKQAMLKHRAPVVVIYNHFAIWHAAVIVGFDDDRTNDQCAFVKEWIRYMNEEDFDASEVEVAFAREGCNSRGVFYVRDSIYDGDLDSAMYDYDRNMTGEEAPYSKPIVEHSYDWLKYLGNHAYVIYAKS